MLQFAVAIVRPASPSKKKKKKLRTFPSYIIVEARKWLKKDKFTWILWCFTSIRKIHVEILRNGRLISCNSELQSLFLSMLAFFLLFDK
jgi:hypothetical protein